ncbi:MAG TPA: carboxymuconolactone decarboxylase family protein [Saprospiraceae bacterium]|nr:carboxymuconolactone decarboxylase family protein [Saprospiraceae bacterium]
MGQPLIPTIPKSETDHDLNKLIQFYNETLGFCPNSVLTMYHRPSIAYAFIELNKAVMDNHESVSSSLKRLIAYVSSNTAGCTYCQAHTIRAAERYGADEKQLNEVWDFERSDAFTEKEKAALSFAVHGSMVPNAINDQMVDRLKNHWTHGEIVEITGVIALFGFLNRWNDTMATTLENGAVESAEKLLSNRGWQAGKHSNQ